MLGPVQDFRHDDGVADRLRRPQHAQDISRQQVVGPRRLRAGSGSSAGLQPAQLMVKHLMQMGFELVIGQIDFLAQMTCVLGNLLRATHVLAHLAADSIPLVGQLGIDHLRLNRPEFRSGSFHARRNQPGRWRWLGRRLWSCWLRPELWPLGLSFGRSPHLRHATEKVFDFVFHISSKFKVQSSGLISQFIAVTLNLEL
jgi:hypothetical protein